MGVVAEPLAAVERASAPIENKTFDDLTVGQSASLTHRLTRADVELFAVVSGDVNPEHLDETFAARTLFRHVVAHGMWSGALISAVLGTRLPGPGSIYLSQDLKFLKPIRLNDRVTVTVTVLEKREKQHVLFDCKVVREDGEELVRGTALVKAPAVRERVLPADLPDVQLQHHDRFKQLIQRCQGLAPLRTAVVHPCDGPSLLGAFEAAEAGLVIPVFVGPEAKIKAVAAGVQADLSYY
ncbi:MAG: MaoC family dehydratase N-terminal domain-containing protein, partial [Acidobacteriaceae bacterium]|nr:MaoC family dehydratase N-terminal domain-containing protein [Acidobacteriaceae bacterium]